MKNSLLILAILVSGGAIAQSDADKEAVEQTCFNYLDGFYQGDTVKLKLALKPNLYKIGFWKAKDASNYESEGQMTYEQAIKYAKGVAEKKNFASSSAPRNVEVLDIMNHIAAVKITAWWGIDYALLSKSNGTWMIEEVIWEGPLEKK